MIQTTTDVGATALISPATGFCGQTNTQVDVAVRVHNYGSADQTNVPVSVKITDAANTEVATLTGTVSNANGLPRCATDAQYDYNTGAQSNVSVYDHDQPSLMTRKLPIIPL